MSRPDNAESDPNATPQRPLLELSGRSREVLDVLADGEGQAAVLYEGALRVLADGENRARVRLAACALRELLDDFQDAPKGENLKVRVAKLKSAWEVPEKVDAGADPFANALGASAAAEDTSSATFGPRYKDVRFDFADAIVVHLLGFKLPEQEDEFSELVQSLREAHLALGHFILGAVLTYLGWHPPPATSAI